MSWATRRKTLYSGILILIITLFVGVVYFLFLYEKPTCFDKKQNQDEQGIDCGGVCEKVCDFSAIDPVILWSRTFDVSKGVYNSIALIENPNRGAEAKNVAYSFKIYDSENILIAERRGKVDVLPYSVLPIFERSIQTGERIPVRTFFEFLNEPNWVKSNLEISNLFIEDEKLSNVDENPRLDAIIMNNTDRDIKNIKVTAIVYDSEGNAVNSSQTIVDALNVDERENLVFTWPKPFNTDVSRVEIIPIVE